MTTYGTRALRKIQIGKETTHGTAVAATYALYGKMTMEEPRKLHMPTDEEVGALAAATRSEVVSVGPVNIKWDQEGVSYEQVLHALHMGVKGGITASQLDTETAYSWTFSPSLTASPAPNSFTIEHGDNLQAFEAEYCMG